MWLQNIKISTRLTLGFSVIGLLVVIVSMLTLSKVSAIGNVWQDYQKTILPKEKLIEDSLARWQDNIFPRLAKYVDKGEDYAPRFLSGLDIIDKDMISFRAFGALSAKELELTSGILASTQIYRKIAQQTIAMKEAGAKPAVMKQFIAEGPRKPVESSFDALIKISHERTANKSNELTTLVLSTEAWVLWMLLVMITVAGIAVFFITRSITNPLRKAVKIAKQVAAGDLTGHIQVTSRDETGELLQALKTMNDGILCIAKEVRASSNTITVAVKEIAVGNSDLSQRTEEQASSLEETASSMEELISTVKQNADNSKQADHLASSASNVAIKGGDIVGKVVVTMDLISGSSKKIVDIISVIEGIAFQTNILSLNAAVEAARAGEQGRGFAVVAGEVRNLAQRSAAAAKEIKALIDDSVGKVSDGTKLVEEAGRTMDEIVTSVKKVNDIIAEIAAASEEQISGIEQVNQAIVQMDEVTQQNAALVEEAAASAAALEEQATNLNMAVGLFKLGGVAQTQPVSSHSSRVEAAPVGGKRKKLSATRRPGSPAAVTTPARPAKVANLNGDWQEF